MSPARRALPLVGLVGLAAILVARPLPSGAQPPPGATVTPGALQTAPATPEDPQVAQGRYLAVVGDCEGCHDRPGGTPYAGGLPLRTPFGTIYSANLTQDRETGIGAWTADDFWNAMHKGVRRDGAKLYPAFPYPYFTHITRAESDALYAYFRTIAPVSYRPPANKLPFPLNLRFMVGFWNALYFKVDDHPSTGPSPGRHIVEGLGHCGACHTPKTFLGGDKNDHALEGGQLDNWAAPAINSDVRRGLGSWSSAEIAEYLKTGRNARANASASMADVVRYSTSLMNDADLAAIGDDLRGRPSHAGPVNTSLKPDPKLMARGEAIYVDECATCHAVDGKAQPGLFPPLPGAGVTQSTDPTTVIRFILSGTQTVATNARPTPFAMPSFGWKLTDDEVAAVATYVRNSWGNVAPAVGPSEVGKLRGKVGKPIQKPSARV
ncbi:MAG: c-type cytochrome [Proteobacteria bacterium]|nr:c-type cytochrome [Pseudomonadota bacterium]